MSLAKTTSPAEKSASAQPSIADIQDRLSASFESADLAAAYDNLVELNRLQPGSPALETTAGVIALQLTREGEATMHFAKALSLAPDDYDANYNMALNERRLRRYDLALERLHHLRRLNPAEPSLLNDMAVIWSDKGKPGRSLACFSRALKLDPNAAEPRNHAMQFMRRTRESHHAAPAHLSNQTGCGTVPVEQRLEQRWPICLLPI